MVNLIKFLPSYFNRISLYDFKENKNILSLLIISFISGLFFASKFLEKQNFIFPLSDLYISASVLFIALIIIALSHYFNLWFLKHLIIVVVFFVSAFIWLGIKAINNQTIFLENELKKVYIHGEITKVKEYSHTHLKSLYLTNVGFHNGEFQHPLPKGIKLFTYSKVPLKKKDIIWATVNLQPIYSFTPFENHWQTKAYWENIGANGFIISKIRYKRNFDSNKDKPNYFQWIKDYFLQKISLNMSSRVVGVAEAITFGFSKNLNQKDRDNLQKAGLGPFIAISGLHIGIIATFIFILVRKLLALFPIISLNIDTKKIAAILAIIVISFYLILLEDIPSAFRAGTMAILLMVGIIFGICSLSLNNLLLAIFIILLLKPQYISSTSFILSLTATAVVVSFLNSSLIKKIKSLKCMFMGGLIKWVVITSLLSLVVNIILFPLIVHYFQKVPLYGVLTNIIITPLFSMVIMPFLFLAIILPDPLCLLFFKISEISIVFMLKVASFIGNLESSIIWFPIVSHYLIIIYIILFLLFIIIRSKIRYLFLILCGFIVYYIFINPLPNIIIDKNMKLLAFLDLNSKKYILNTFHTSKTISKVWFKDNSKLSSKNINNSKIFIFCNKGYIINETPYIFFDPILKQINIVNGDNKIIIDKNFIQKNGSSFIYLVKPNIINIISNKSSLRIYDKSNEK